MKLKLLVENKRGGYFCFYEEEIELPNYPELSFEDNVDMRKLYAERIVQGLEIKHQIFLEGKNYQPVLVAESKVSEEIKKLDFK